MIINYKSFIMDYWDSIIIILLLVAQIIIMCLKLFGKSFVKTLGTNIADLVTTRTKTKIEENVKLFNSYSEEFCKEEVATLVEEYQDGQGQNQL